MLNALTQSKVVITTVPFVDDKNPLAAPAVLKASLIENGIPCVGLDLNIEIYNKIQHHPNKQWFLAFFYNQIIREEIVEDLVKMLDFYVVEIMSHSPNIVGLSLFSQDSQVFTMWLCAMLRHKAPDVKIIIGGPGLATLENSLFKFPDRLKQLGLIDAYITGDAEVALVEYVQGNDYLGINSSNWQPNKNFNMSPIADFSDYRFFKYQYALLPIVDSRGCVQDCEFCDVVAFWKKFQYLNAEDIFQRMQHYINLHGTYRFQFSSSICNGNLREFKKLVNLIAQYNRQVVVEEEKIHWVGSFIVRPASQHPESLWQTIKDSNGFLLTGVESIVEHVRINLGKKFTNADLDHHLDMAKKYQVQMNLLMIAAYPTETPEDFETSKQWFRDHKDFANNPIHKVQITLPAILPGTKLESTVDQQSFNLNSVARRQHGTELLEVIKQCGFNAHHFF